MGFSYRKSIKAGPIRITASTSGISYSAGIKGARVTKRADGRVQTTLSAPGTGLRYTSTTGSKAKKTTDRPTAVEKLLHETFATEALYRKLYPEAVRDLRDNGYTPDQLREALRAQGITHPRVLKAVADAEKYLADEAGRQQKVDAKNVHDEEIRALATEAAQMLSGGSKPYEVDRELKKRGIRFMMRGEIINKAKKIAKLQS